MESEISTREWLSAQLRSGKRPSLAEVSQACGVTRQRASQLYKALGEVPGASLSSGPQARLRTGGIDVPLSSSVVGSISELLAAADLMARGYQVFAPVGQTVARVDLIALDHRGHALRIEVRSGHRRADGTGFTWARNPRHRQPLVDHYAIVVTGEPVVYSPALPGARDTVPESVQDFERKAAC